MKDHLIVPEGKKLRLKDYDTGSQKDVPERAKAEELTTHHAIKIGEYQDLLYADGRHALLVVLQGLDGSGKDGTVRKVFDAVNPTGIVVTSFKTPTPVEQRHDFLWRCHQAVPPHGHVGVFNRSYYEDVLIVRVHADQFLPPHLREEKSLWQDRFAMINSFEALMSQNNTHVLKFFLHISKEEQKDRFLARQRDPQKHWKLAAGDFEERQFWNDYEDAYEDMLAHTSTDIAPWYIIPSDRKWVRNYHISRIICQTLKDMDLKWPPVADKSLVTKKFK